MSNSPASKGTDFIEKWLLILIALSFVGGLIGIIFAFTGTSALLPITIKLSIAFMAIVYAALIATWFAVYRTLLQRNRKTNELLEDQVQELRALNQFIRHG